MMRYRDRTYCRANCSAECSKKLTQEVRDAAVKWWGNEGAPIAVADLSSYCERYVEEVKNER